MIIDGRKMAGEVLARAKARAEKLPHSPRVLAIVANETPVTKSYLAIKQKRAADAGCMLEVRRVDMTGIQDMMRSHLIVDSIKKAAEEANAIVVQLPLPAGVDTKTVCDAIPLEKDADVLSSAARKKFESGDADALLPPVVGAVRKILEFGNVEIAGKRAVVIGAGFLVGSPVASWLMRQGAQVNVIADPAEFAVARVPLATADIVISGVGSPHLIKPDMLKTGVVLIDAGTSESNGALVGDADPSCAAKCSIFTPVPGGVGPLAVACLFENVVTLAERAIGK